MVRTYRNMRATRLTRESHRQTCGYWYTVCDDGMSHTAFGTRAGLDRWLDERGLSLEGDLTEPGESCLIVGEYRTDAHFRVDPSIVEDMKGLHTRTLSNGDWVVAVITDDNGIRTVHTLNPNVRGRIVYGYESSNILMGGSFTGNGFNGGT